LFHREYLLGMGLFLADSDLILFRPT
jgi:hypothetical protein